jgi:site-specific recombinase XerD
MERGYLSDSLRHSGLLQPLVVDLRMIKELGGWKRLSIVRRYTHPAPGHQRQAIERLVPR